MLEGTYLDTPESLPSASPAYTSLHFVGIAEAVPTRAITYLLLSESNYRPALWPERNPSYYEN
jgi:hypothetical protein